MNDHPDHGSASGPADDDAAAYPPRGYVGFGGIVRERASESVPSWRPNPRAEQGAPNVVVVLLDDMGFSDIGPFGSEIVTPTLDSLAKTGYRLTGYHTPPMCAPARAALMTSLNPHRAGFCYVPHMDPGFPNATMEISEEVPTLAESFRASGWATFMVGKWHLTVESRIHDAADKSSWPIQRGFDRYLGCMDGFTSMTHPHRLVRDNSPLVIDEFPDGYYLTDVLTDEAITMVRELRGSDPDKPFFLYFAHQAVHAPLQAKAADIDRYRGRYDTGWDAVRGERFARQVADGLLSPDATCAPRNTEQGFDVPAWDDLTDEQRSRFARYMEVYAAMVDNVDQNLARLLAAIGELGELDNTIVVFTSDNGASPEGGSEGTRSYFSQFHSQPVMPEQWEPDVVRDPALIGGPRAFVHYPRGWAWASNTPFRLYKTHTYAGGVRVPMVLSWPAGLPRAQDDVGVRRQHLFTTDLGPTLMELAGVEPLRSRGGLAAPDVDGVSAVPMLRDASSPGPRAQQLFEISGRRALIDGHWKVVTPHDNGPDWREDEWELYDIGTDPAETRNLADQHPQRVDRMARRWKQLAWHNTVFPLNDDGSMFRVRPSTELPLEAPVTLRPFQPTLERYRSAKLTRFRSFTVEVRLTPRPGDEGVLFAHGDQGGGYVVYLENGQVHLSYNEFGRMHRASADLPCGVAVLEVRFVALEDLSWAIMVSADGRDIATLPRVIQLFGQAPFTGVSVGLDRGGPVDWELSRRRGCFRYSGRLESVRYVPAAKAEYNRELIIDILHRAALAFE